MPSTSKTRREQLLRTIKYSHISGWFLFLIPFLLSAGFFLGATLFVSNSARATVLLVLLITYLFCALIFDLFLRNTSWRRLKHLVFKHRHSISTKRLLWALGIYLFLLVIASLVYWWFVYLRLPETLRLLQGRSGYVVIGACVISYLLGLAIRDVLRYRVRMFAAPLVLSCFLLFLILLVLVVDEGKSWVWGFLGILKDHPWSVVLAIVLLKWSPQIGSMLPRIQKAELPGGPKLEIAKLEEIQQEINPWKKTVSRFADLMDWVGKLIVDTPPDDTVKLLAYTPALGFLTRTEGDWRKLHKLLVERSNIQIICLREDYLKKWHADFKNKRTSRPEGVIQDKLIERANRISAEIVADKRRQVDSKMEHVIEKTWDEMPGYYLFANSKRAIIAAPLFLPNDPYKPDIQGEADNYLGNTPVKMLGFESSDTWTVWLVNQVCEYYVKAKIKNPEPIKTTFPCPFLNPRQFPFALLLPHHHSSSTVSPVRSIS